MVILSIMLILTGQRKIKMSGSTKKVLLLSKKEGGETQKPFKENEANWQWVNRQKKLYETTPKETNLILKEVSGRFPDKDQRLKALAILRLGTPYQLDCLGEESGRDKDPIFRLDVTDCTAFVLTTVALLHSQTLQEARGMMKYLNYRPNSTVTFENRLHFTTDRNMVSPYFQDISEQIAGPDKIKKQKIVLNKVKQDGHRLVDIDWQKEITMKYIPTKYVTKKLFARLPEAVGIAFVKEGDEKIGLDVRHEGFLFDQSLLCHASSIQKKVVMVNFWNHYFNKNNSPWFDGIILYKIL